MADSSVINTQFHERYVLDRLAWRPRMLALSPSRCDEPTPLPIWSAVFSLLLALIYAVPSAPAQEAKPLDWQELPSLPNPLGVAGPYVGVHNQALIVAGGANFPLPVWESDKQWHDEIFVLLKRDDQFSWQSPGQLHRPLAYGANVSTPAGVICLGGNDADAIRPDCFVLQWHAEERQVRTVRLPDLPIPLAYGQACWIDHTIYLAGGQTTSGLESAVQNMWTLDVSSLDSPPEDGSLNADLRASDALVWREHTPWPGPPRAFNMTVAQNNGFDDCVYVIGGRYQQGESIEFLSDCWEYNPRTDQWRERAGLPHPVTAGTAIGFGQSHVFILSGDDGTLFHRTDELRDQHPGFPRRTFAYNTITDSWVSLGDSPSNQVTTTAVSFDDAVVLASGEVRPRVRSPKVWRISVPATSGSFGMFDYGVVVLYLASLLGIGVYFSRRTTNTDDYFRGAGKIPWWAAGCSIFATMLSSLTFTGIPSKAFAQDWVYAVGNMMIPVVAFAAVGVALPFYRRIDATSAYEYLEKRFHFSLRIFGSVCFSTFHVFRMAIVMSLTGLALAVATPLTPSQSVLLMGVLSIIYCSLGGISAVIWTDTLQTFVLLGGALLAIVWMLNGSGSTLGESFATAQQYDKLNFANWHLNPTHAQVALWVILIGAIGQNFSSYTADQAVVQRYMTTPSQALAARAIWTNALLTIPATILFFGLGTGLFLYYRAHPDRFDPTITTDQVFPLFISRELPSGLSGLIVAAIFAAAQSTISTSMNSVATALLTDCVRPWSKPLSERHWLRLAQVFTVCLGVAGTVLALFFISPDIRSLFDQFIKVIGLFMGVLGGLFLLGVLVPRANASGAWLGAISGCLVMFAVWKFTIIQGYLYTAIGIVTCLGLGWLGSLGGNHPSAHHAARAVDAAE